MNDIKDPMLYRRLSEPHASLVDLDTALDGFSNELRVIREKYKIADVVVVILSNAMDGAEEKQIATMGHHGDPSRTEMMLAWALGQERRQREKILRELAREPN